MDKQTLHLLQHTTRYFSAQQQRPYLVGGSLRNLLLGEECLDWDIVTPGNAPKTARQLADTLGGHYVRMHARASRVIIVVEDTDSLHTRKEICFDISPLIGKTIEDDLRQRDFTINAIAAPLDEVVRYLEIEMASQPHHNEAHPPYPEGDRKGAPLLYNEGTNSNIVGASLAGALGDGMGTLGSWLIDPLDSLSDLQAHRLKAVDDQVFRHDPLRMLRAVRLMTRYQLQIDPWTASLITRDAQLLPEVAWERIHDELYAILGPDGAITQLHFLDEHNLFITIIPEFLPARGMRQPRPHHWDVLTHSIETVGALERIAHLIQGEPMHALDPVGPPFMRARQGGEDEPTNIDLTEISSILQEAEQQGIFSFAGLTAPRMKMAALLHDIGKPVTYSCDEEGAIHFYNHPLAGVPLVEQIMRRLCASTQDRRLAQLVAAHHMRPGQLGQDGPVTLRAIRRYFVDLGPTGIYVALFSLADHLATLGPQPAGNAWQRHLVVVRQLLTSYIRERDSILPPRLISPEELIRRLKIAPGPIVGQLLDLISEAQAEGKIHSKEEAIWFAEEHLPS
ncbi:MAG: HD domain-containing protein [Ktedonobacteraceae bacterium]